MNHGDLVVCINDAFSDLARQHCRVLPVAGVIYTIREIVPSLTGKRPPGYLLEEIVNPPIMVRVTGRGIIPMEPGFVAERFRPIEKPSIEPLRALIRESEPA